MKKRFIALGIFLIVFSVCIAGCSHSPSSSTSTVAIETTAIGSNGIGTISVVKTVPAVISAPTKAPSPIVIVSENSVMYPYGLEITVKVQNTANSRHSAFITAKCYKDNIDISRTFEDVTLKAYETQELHLATLSKECADGTYNVTVTGSD